MLVFRLLLHILPLLVALPVGGLHLLMTPRQKPVA
jgi:hypothetical protein